MPSGRAAQGTTPAFWSAFWLVRTSLSERDANLTYELLQTDVPANVPALADWTSGRYEIPVMVNKKAIKQGTEFRVHVFETSKYPDVDNMPHAKRRRMT